jgi:hypothetical protein
LEALDTFQIKSFVGVLGQIFSTKGASAIQCVPQSVTSERTDQQGVVSKVEEKASGEQQKQQELAKQKQQEKEREDKEKAEALQRQQGPAQEGQKNAHELFLSAKQRFAEYPNIKSFFPDEYATLSTFLRATMSESFSKLLENDTLESTAFRIINRMNTDKLEDVKNTIGTNANVTDYYMVLDMLINTNLEKSSNNGCFKAIYKFYLSVVAPDATAFEEFNVPFPETFKIVLDNPRWS